MEAALKREPVGDARDEVERLRGIFSSAFPREAGEPFQPHTSPSELNPVAATSVQPASPCEELDWSITLGNIAQLTNARKASEARRLAAEERAAHAEAKAKEAEHWLRRLHQAVLDGLPGTKAST